MRRGGIRVHPTGPPRRPLPSVPAARAADDARPALRVVTCPHCDTAIEILAVNCAIFRCGVFRRTMAQIPPHAPKEQCDAWARAKKIWGCGKPFRLRNDQAVACDYL